MLRWRLKTWLLIVWTLIMAVWLVLYREADVTCGPEIYRNCQIGLEVTAGLGRPGVVLLWSLGVVALAMTWLTDRRPKPAGAPTPQHGVVKLAALIVPVAAVMVFASSTAPLTPAPPAPKRSAVVHVRVLSAVLLPAVTPSRRRRHRARLSVHVRVTNTGKRTIADVQPVLLAPARVLPDPRAMSMGSLLRPVPPGFSAGGTLRFEIEGAITDAIVDARRATLRIAGRNATLAVRIRSVRRRAAVPRKPAPTVRPAPALRRPLLPTPRPQRPRSTAPAPARKPPPPPPTRRPPPLPPPPVTFDDSG